MKNYTLLFSLLISLNTIAQNNIQPNSSSSYNYLNEISSPNSNVMISEYVRTLSTDTLFVVLELSSIEENSEILFSVGSEIIYRIKNKLITNKFINQLSRDNISNEYLGVLFMILNKTFRSFQNEDLILIFNTSSFYVTNDFYSNPNKLSLDIRLIILKTNNLILTHLNESNQVSINKVNKYCRILQLIMVNNRENPEIRAAAIKGIQYLNYKEATNSLIVLMSDYSNINNEVLMQPLCIILSQFNEPRSFQLIESILKNTTNEYVFASAAISLGDLGGLQSLKALIENENKFEGKYTGVAIRRLNDDIFTILKNRNSSYIDYAIKATKYLYKEDETIQYKKLLKSILFTTQNINHIKLILDRLYQVINKEEASEIISKLTYNNLYLLEWNKINNLQKTETTPIKNSNILVPEKPIIINNNRNDQGNMTQQEYGDAAYQDNTFDFWIVNYEWCGHAGLYAGINSNHEQRQIAVTKVGTTAPRDRPWTNMTSDPDNPYWGAYTLDPNSESLSFTDRKDIISTAIELIAYAPSYPAFNLWPDALNYFVYPGIYVYPYDIEKLRCDGLVEYCYEWNYHEVWGYNSANYDISITSNVDSHNYCFHANYQNPCETLAPIVQCGGHGNSNANGGCSNLDNDATIDYPTYNANYSLSGNSVNVSIQANDKSGIHYIKYKVGSDGSVIASPTQPQHPTSSSYTYSFTVAMSESDYIYFYAKDNGGNYPQYYSYIYITLPPDPPSSLNATAISSSQINLSWTNVPDEDGYKLYRSLSASGTYSQIETLGANVTTYSNTDLNPNTQYCYKVESYNSAGSSGYSPYDCATTDQDLPSSPSWFTATTYSNSQINVSWEDVTNEDGYKLYRSLSASGTYSQIETLGANVTTYSNTDLNPNTQYCYKVESYNSAGSSGYSPYDCATTDQDLPSSPSWFTATTYSNSQINVSWEDVTNEDGYKLYRSLSASGTYSQIETLGANVTTYSNTDLNPNTQYCYKVESYNSAGSSGYSPYDCATTDQDLPSSPSWLTATTYSNSQINISWEDVTNEDGYKLYRSLSASGTYSQIETLGANVTTYSNTDLNPNTQYCYKVEAYNGAGNSGYSPYDCATTDQDLPSSPSWLTATTYSNSQINISWEDVTNEDGYKLYRSLSASGTYSQIETLGANVTTYSNTDLNPNTQYCYKVEAYNGAGNSGYSSYDCATTFFGDYLIVTSPNGGEEWEIGSIHNITWDDNIDENVRIELLKNDDFVEDIIESTYSDGIYSWTIPSNLEPDIDYTICIVCVDDDQLYDLSDDYFEIWLETSFITVTSPNGGEDWEIGSTHNITWDDNIDENVRIELLKNDDFVEDIIESTYSDGIYSWTIPTNLEPDNDYSIGIVSIDDDELYDISDGHFEIWADPQDYITVTSPNGGEEWEIGSIHNITWDDNIDENVRIELLKNDDFVEDIIESTYSDGIYSWTIPSNLEPDIDYTICIVCVDDDQLYDLSDDYFEIWLETSFITVTSPNGGEDWEIGSTHNITWDDNIDENVRIELLKNDDFVEDIIESTYSDGIYSWTIPTNLEPDNDYSIGIVSIDDDELYDISDGHFEIWADPQDYITVTSPNGGEDWEVGTSHTISWDYKITGNVKIELYVGSSYNSTIISSTSCDGSYTWNIPANQPSGTNYKVKITSLSNTSIYDFSDGYFEILPADYITVTSPNGGEDWEAGTSHTLTWDYNITGNVKIELYVGSSYNSTIISSTSCDVSYTWSIPANQPSGTNYKVKITSLSNISIYDFSDDYFEILPSNPNDYVTVYSPNSGESWQAPSQHIIEWGDDIYENVKIELYKNGFIYFLITNSYPSDGSYPWTVPSNIETSNYYKIKIVSVDNPDIFDFSDEYFTIINSDGINDLFISNNLKVYPNPTNNSLIIETTSIVLSLEKVIITDMIGKEIYKNGSGEIGSRLEINVSMFNAGVYFTTLYTNKGAITKKIIIQH